MKRRIFSANALAALFIVFVLMFSACSAMVSSDRGERENAGETAGEDAYDNEAGRKLVRSGALYLETKEFDTLYSAVNGEIARLGGYVENSRVTGGDAKRRAEITARVPAESFEDFFGAVKELGSVTSESTYVKDITLTYIDIESRLKALREEEAALLALFEGAANLENLITIRSRLTEVRSEIEDYESRLRVLENSVSYSVVTLRIDEVERITPTVKTSVWTRIKDNFIEGVENVYLFIKEAFVFILASVPYLVLVGVLAAPVLFAGYRKRKKGKRKNENKGPEEK